jgi:Ala-tRNA(Pro) deacylase
MSQSYEQLMALLDRRGGPYQVLQHAPEGRSNRVAILRGTRPEAGAKAMVVRLHVSKRGRRHCLAVIPGDRRIDLDRLSAECQVRSATLAPTEVAEELTGCAMGAARPFSFHQDLPVIVDPTLLRNDEIVFNTGRLDRSIRLSAQACLDVAKPRVAAIVESA